MKRDHDSEQEQMMKKPFSLILASILACVFSASLGCGGSGGEVEIPDTGTPTSEAPTTAEPVLAEEGP